MVFVSHTLRNRTIEWGKGPHDGSTCAALVKGRGRLLCKGKSERGTGSWVLEGTVQDVWNTRRIKWRTSKIVDRFHVMPGTSERPRTQQEIIRGLSWEILSFTKEQKALAARKTYRKRSRPYVCSSRSQRAFSTPLKNVRGRVRRHETVEPDSTANSVSGFRFERNLRAICRRVWCHWTPAWIQ